MLLILNRSCWSLLVQLRGRAMQTGSFADAVILSHCGPFAPYDMYTPFPLPFDGWPLSDMNLMWTDFSKIKPFQDRTFLLCATFFCHGRYGPRLSELCHSSPVYAPDRNHNPCSRRRPMLLSRRYSSRQLILQAMLPRQKTQ